MDYRNCIICQATKSEPLRCKALDLNTTQTHESHGLFLSDWELFRSANIAVDVSLPIAEATIDNLLTNEVKWHGNCHRNVCHDRLLRKQKTKKDERTSSSKLELVQNDLYITHGKNVLHVGRGTEMTEECDHEEADTRIVIHILHVLHEGAKTVLVQTVDSDVVVILITHFNLFDSLSHECEVFVSFGNGKYKRILNIRLMSLALGVQRCTALPLWVTLNRL